MQSNFDKCLEHVLKREGGFINRPADRGGATNYGITKATLSDFRGYPVSDKDVFDLTREEAEEIYRIKYWAPMKLETLRYFNVQLILFDQGVNRGPVSVIRMLQEVLNINFAEKLAVDGFVGPRTEVAVATAATQSLCRKLIQFSQRHYCQLVIKDPTQAEFLMGWMNRTFALQDAVA